MASVVGTAMQHRVVDKAIEVVADMVSLDWDSSTSYSQSLANAAVCIGRSTMVFCWSD